MAYQFVPEKKNVIYPPRIQQIADEYERHGFEYTGPNPDNDMESFREIGYERRAKIRPDTAFIEVISVYRLLDEYSEKEYMIWKEVRHVSDKEDKDYHIDVVMGKRPSFEVISTQDEEGNDVDKRISKTNMVYTVEWDIPFFEELLKKSRTKKTRLYIASTSTDYYTNYTGVPIRIKETDIFKKSSHEELVKYDRMLEKERLLQTANSMNKK